MSQQVCICGKIKTDRIGEIMVPNVKERSIRVYRFALDCPVHGIKYRDGNQPHAKPEPPVDQKEQNRINRELRRKRRLAEKEAQNARHSDVQPAGLPGGEELPEKSA